MIRLSRPATPSPDALLWAAIGMLTALELLRLAATFAHPPAPGLGWDFRVLCDALDVLRRGGNPYLVGNLADHTFDYPYLPTVAYLVSPACAASPRGSPVFAILFLALLSGSTGLASRGAGATWRESVLLGLCALGAFDTARWMAMTGNAAILETPLAALAVVAWHRGRPTLAGASLGALASFKLLPLVLLGAFPLLLPGRPASRAIAAGLALFLPIVAFGFWLAGPNAHDYLRTITGQIPGQHSPFHEHLLGAADPNLPDFLARASAAIGLDHPGPPATVLALLFLAAGALIFRLRASPSMPVFCATLIVLALALFRLKPYAYASLTLFALAACLDRGRIAPIRLLAVMAGIAIARILGLLPRLGPVVLDYYQLVGLLLALGALFVSLLRRPLIASGGPGSARDPRGHRAPDPVLLGGCRSRHAAYENGVWGPMAPAECRGGASAGRRRYAGEAANSRSIGSQE